MLFHIFKRIEIKKYTNFELQINKSLYQLRIISVSKESQNLRFYRILSIEKTQFYRLFYRITFFYRKNVIQSENNTKFVFFIT